MPSARRDAISAIGITLIENGRITNSYYTLVDPACPFDPFTVELTGITPEMAAAFPEFGELWEQIRPWLEGALLCAHGASGDLHVLARTLRRYKIDWVEKAPFLCTVEAAKQCFPELERYSLNLACKALDIPLQHHLASSDAAAAAALLLRCMERDPSLPEHAKEFDMREARIVGVTKKRPRRKKSGAALNVETELKKLSSKTFAAARRVQYRDTGEELLGVLHAYLLDMKPGFDACLAAVDAFLPLVENDDVFFALKPRALLRDPVRIEESCRGWIGSDHPYTVAFGIRMLAQAISPKTFDPDAFDRSLAEQIAGMHIDHPTVALAAADYFFRLLKYGGEENGAYIRGIAESCTAAKRGLYFYEKDQEALSLQEPAF